MPSDFSRFDVMALRRTWSAFCRPAWKWGSKAIHWRQRQVWSSRGFPASGVVGGEIAPSPALQFVAFVTSNLCGIQDIPILTKVGSTIMKHQCAAISHVTKCDKMRYRILSHRYRILWHFVACDIAFCCKLKNTFFSTTVWTSENAMNFSGGTENKSDVFLDVIRKRIFLSAQFLFSHKKEMRRGAETAVWSVSSCR